MTGINTLLVDIQDSSGVPVRHGANVRHGPGPVIPELSDVAALASERNAPYTAANIFGPL